MVMRLNIGCGRKPLANAINLDVSPDVGADVVHDLNCLPWPFAADEFQEVHAYDVLEHVLEVPKVLEEVHRICRSSAVLHVTVPHFSSANAFTDVTHRSFFSTRSFEPFGSGKRQQCGFVRCADEIKFLGHTISV